MFINRGELGKNTEYPIPCDIFWHSRQFKKNYIFQKTKDTKLFKFI